MLKPVKVKLFGGKRYYIHYGTDTKAEAVRRAETWRKATKTGARVVKVGKGYIIYVRDSIK